MKVLSMDTNKLKKFAVDARNKIKTGVEAKLSTLGFDSKGNVPDSMKPQLMQGGSLWNGQLMTESFYHQWMALYDAVRQHGVHHIYEEAAYTWFNRLVAIRILQKNGIIEPVLSSTDEARTPKIVDDARSAGRIPPMSEADRQRLMELLDDDTKVTEQFAILITAYCHANPVIRQSFGRMADYTELLLPNNILAEGGFIDELNHTEFITDDDYKSSELIGWLYQFYISERKDEVFAKKGKYDADEIAPATQIFTPHWIVEYMVQNTIGRIYLDNHPDDADIFKPKWKYLVGQEQRDEEHIYHFDELPELKFADLGCGSGHILGYMFDLLFDLYIYEGYTRKEAVTHILQDNITGVDIDLRAKQLATFALLLKACQKDESFKDGEVLPNVLTMPEPVPESDRRQLFHDFFKGEETNNILAELDDAFDLLKDAQTLGSIMKFDLSKSTLLAIRQTMDYWKDKSIVPESVEKLLPSFKIILALTQKYTALVMNPPYMGSGRFDNVLSKYVKNNYASGKADLFSVFMLVAQQRLVPNGKYAMINMQSWMFLSSFEQLRKNLLETMQIDSMLHLGPHTFDELSGEVVQNTSFVVSNHEPNGTGIYYRLVEGRNCADKEHQFLAANQDSVVAVPCAGQQQWSQPLSETSDGTSLHGRHKARPLHSIVRYDNVKQSDFEKIPGFCIAYWMSDAMKSVLSLKSSSCILKARHGLLTGNDSLYLRLWFEIPVNEIGFGFTNYKSMSSSTYKYYPMNKGGDFRRWYGNQLVVVKTKNSLEKFNNNKLSEKELFFKEGVTWTEMDSKLGFRYSPSGILFGHKGATAYFNNRNDLNVYLGYANSVVFRKVKELLFTGLSFTAGNLENMPFEYNSKGIDMSLVTHNISLSKLDWDSHETSWDFKANPLVAIMQCAEGVTAGGEGRDDAAKKPQQQSSDNCQPIGEQLLADCPTTVSQSSNNCQPMSSQPFDDALTPSLEGYHAEMEKLSGLCHTQEGVKLEESTLETAVEAFEKLWEARFYQLHANEEELNRQFIDIYGLQDELTPDVPLDEITILQQGEISFKREQSPSSLGAMPSADEIRRSQMSICKDDDDSSTNYAN